LSVAVNFLCYALQCHPEQALEDARRRSQDQERRRGLLTPVPQFDRRSDRYLPGQHFSVDRQNRPKKADLRGN
jgi:hypothetical protein